MSNANKWIIGIGIVIIVILSYFLLKDNNNKAIVANNDSEVNTTSQMTAATNTAINNVKSTSTQKKMNQYTIKTSKGNIVIELAADKPKTTENFRTLADKGFYDGVRFHRVIDGFMIQTGDPKTKDKGLINEWGTGGPDYKFADELTGHEQYNYGTVAMANSGPNTNGSQFFIVSANPSVALPPSYTVFGRVLSGMDVVESIQKSKTTGYPYDRPIEDIMVYSIGK